MAYLVRKLIKMDNLFVLPQFSDIPKIYADIPTTEFRTKEGALSTWYIDSIDDIENAVLAIAITSSQVEKLDVIIIDTDILLKNCLEYKQTYAGQDIAIPDLQNTHYDIVNVTIEKLTNCTNVYKKIFDNDPECDKFLRRFPLGEIKDMLKRALKNGRIDTGKVSKKIGEELDKLSRVG